MLTGAGLAGVWRHDRAHRFFSAARWSAEALSLALARLMARLLVPAGEPVLSVFHQGLMDLALIAIRPGYRAVTPTA